VGNWKIIRPEATTNEVLNPSAETTGNFAAAGSATVTRVTTYSRYGSYSYQVQTAANNEGITLTLDTLANAIHYVTVRVRGTLPAVWDWSLDNATYTAPALLLPLDGNWSLYGLQFPAAQANGATTLYIHQNGAGSGNFYLDGIQVEEKEYWTSYCDGDQDDCQWSGAKHGSSSSRDALTRAGGRVLDLSDDLSIGVETMDGVGFPPVQNLTVGRGLQDGESPQGAKARPRPLRLRSTVRGSSLSNYHALRQAVVNVIKPSPINRKQPVRLWYIGATVLKVIEARYDGGMGLSGPRGFAETVAIQLIADDDPFFHQEGETSAAIDVNDSATFRLVAGRVNGLWSALGPPHASGTYTNCRAIVVGIDRSIYVSGDFVNFDNIAAADYIVKRSGGAWSALSALNGVVWTMAIAPNGDLYLAGAFTNAGGIADADYIAKWDGSVYSALGTPGAGATVSNFYALVVGQDGILYAAGAFTNLAGVAAADYIAKWDGSAWTAVGASGADDIARCLAIAPNGDLYVGGDFTTIGGVSAARIAKWDGSAYTALGSGCNDSVKALAFSEDGTLYIGGEFTTADGVTVNGVAKWNGVTFEALDSGVESSTQVDYMGFWRGQLIVAGPFTIAGGKAIDQLAAWNGSSWYHLDFQPPTSVTGGPVVADGNDLYVGLFTTGTGSYAGNTTVTPAGTENSYPRIVIKRSGGTSAKLLSIQNETAGKRLLFDYDLLDGETITIDLRPGKRAMTSSFWGKRWRILPNSDLANFLLLPDSQVITAFVETAGSPTMTAFLVYKNTYWGGD
jgi:hypothetical protein